MYQELFDIFNKKMNSFITIESYRGEKCDICWDEIFNDKEIQSKYDITDELKEQLKATTKGHASLVNDKLKSPSIKKSVSVDTTTSAPKKRGRKSKAEKEELLRQQELLERQSDNNVDDESIDIEYEDDTVEEDFEYESSEE